MGCNSAPEENSENKAFLSDIEIIQSMGFHTEGLIEMDNSYIVEGDIEISKELLRNFMHTRQASAPNLVAKSKLNNITYNISNDVSNNSNWASAIDEAIQAWNSIPGSDIY